MDAVGITWSISQMLPDIVHRKKYWSVTAESEVKNDNRVPGYHGESCGDGEYNPIPVLEVMHEQALQSSVEHGNAILSGVCLLASVPAQARIHQRHLPFACEVLIMGPIRYDYIHAVQLPVQDFIAYTVIGILLVIGFLVCRR
jgi:hypothetical protein